MTCFSLNIFNRLYRYTVCRSLFMSTVLNSNATKMVVDSYIFINTTSNGAARYLDYAYRCHDLRLYITLQPTQDSITLMFVLGILWC